jgi:CMP-2-keto-3-deoxyoctulosonic acid synthetase
LLCPNFSDKTRLAAQFTAKKMTHDHSGAKPMTIWVNEQVDPSGIISSCIACCNQEHAEACHDSFEENLTDEQKAAGWIARLRTVPSWDDVPVNALKLD